MFDYLLVYETERAAVYHTALSYLKDTALAEDVMQEVFLTYYNESRAGRPIKHPHTWLLRVTRNRALNLLRDRREQPADDLVDLPLADDSLDPAERFALRAALATLDEQERLLFSLHHLDGYKYREIAAGLSLPVGTVQTRCRTARQKLKAALGGNTQEG